MVQKADRTQVFHNYELPGYKAFGVSPAALQNTAMAFIIIYNLPI
jgi:hypothetical protein